MAGVHHFAGIRRCGQGKTPGEQFLHGLQLKRQPSQADVRFEPAVGVPDRRPATPGTALPRAESELESSAPAGSFDCMIAPIDVVDLGSPITGVIEDILVDLQRRVSGGKSVTARWP